MRFLLFNFAVVAALFYLFNADRSASDLANDLREDPLQAIRQELAAIARDIADDRESTEKAAPRSAKAKISKAPAQEPRSPAVGSEPAAPASTSAETTGRGKAPVMVEKTETAPRQGAAGTELIGALPEVEDPAVARRRAEVLDGARPEDAGRGEAPVEAGPPMSNEERLRKLYSLAEEMELFYVKKTTR